MNRTQFMDDLVRRGGWNTWDTRSVLNHVHLPDGFCVGLGLKAYETGAVLREALIGRFGEREERIHPSFRSDDGSYTALRVTFGPVTFTVESACEGDEQFILVTPESSHRKPPALLVHASVLWNLPGHTRLDGDRLLGTMPSGVRHVYVTGTRVRELNTGLMTPYIAVQLDMPIAIATVPGRDEKSVRSLMDAHKEALATRSARYDGELREAYQAMKTCLAWDTIYEPENRRICSPVSRLWNVSWGGYVMFDWDSYFAALMLSIDNRDLAYANAIAITSEKTERGFIPNFGAANDMKSRDRSQPPVGSMVALEIYLRYPEKWFLEDLFEDLMEWNRWFAAHRMIEDGTLCWGSDPFEPVADRYFEIYHVGDLAGAALESGLDNSPMYDDMPFDESRHLMRLSDVGLTGLYVMDCEALAHIAQLLNKEKERAELLQRAETAKRGIAKLWDDDFGLFLNRRTDNGEFSRRISPTNFYALLSDQIAPDQARRCVDEHFYNPDEFWGEFIMPSIARNDPAYPDQDYWRGRIWAPINFLCYLGLRKQGQQRACADMARKSLDMLLLEWRLHGHVHENNDGDDGMGCGVGNSDKFYHWGGLSAWIALMESGFEAAPMDSISK